MMLSDVHCTGLPTTNSTVKTKDVLKLLKYDNQG